MSKHSIKAHLRDVEDPTGSSYAAMVDFTGDADMEALCLKTSLRAAVGFTKDDLERAVEYWLEEVTEHLCNGYSVKTKWFSVEPWIKGAFYYANAAFDREKHSVEIKLTSSALFRHKLDRTQVEVGGNPDAPISVSHVIDVYTGELGSRATPGKILKIYGNRIKLIGRHPDVGVYFINQSSGDKVKVDTKDIAHNHPEEVIILVPESLLEGDYRLQIKTQFGTNDYDLLEVPRTALFGKTLNVV